MIFVDTSFWVAVHNVRDRHHASANQLLRLHSSTSMLTTNQVRGETWTFLRRREGHRSAVSFIDMLASSPRVAVVHIDDAVEESALNWLRRHPDREYSFVDATSFAVMRAERLQEAFAFDGDFSAAGFRELRAPDLRSSR